MSAARLAVIAAGVLIQFAALWGGAWALDAFSKTWAHFPTFATALMIWVGGWLVVGYGAIEMEPES